MITFGRTVAAFGLMVFAGYLAVVAFTPPPVAGEWRSDELTGTSAAARLSQEARALVSHKPGASLQ